MTRKEKTNAQILAEAIAALEKNDDGAVDAKLLEEEVSNRIQFDADTARLDKARRIIENARKPGQTDPDGQLKFENMDAYEYEPLRLVMGSDHDIIVNKDSKPYHKGAEAMRTMENANRTMQQATRRQQEANHYATWAMEQHRAGRDWTEITFDAFVREATIRRDTPT